MLARFLAYSWHLIYHYLLDELRWYRSHGWLILLAWLAMLVYLWWR